MNLAVKVTEDPRAPSTCLSVWKTFSRVQTFRKWKEPPDCDGDEVEAPGRRRIDLSDRRFPQECHSLENRTELPLAHDRTRMHWYSTGGDQRPWWVPGKHPWV